ncbi:MAG: hypothetical protein OXI57_11655 [Rhodospirillales bacterium]|nr:hypothetical protein [Rhodospirillales bacterium]
MRKNAFPVGAVAFAAVLALGGCVEAPSPILMPPVEDLGSTESTEDTEGIAVIEAKVASLEAEIAALKTMDRRARLRELAKALHVSEDAARQDAFLQRARRTGLPDGFGFRVNADGATPIEGHAVGNWRSKRWESSHPAGTRTAAVVYNDQGPARDVSLGSRYAVLQGGTGANRELFIDPSVSEGGQIEGSWLPDNINHETVTITALGRRGTFGGVPGIFRAFDGQASETEAVTVGVNAAGHAIWAELDDEAATPESPKLLFLPDEGVTAVATVSDASYMNAGWWLTTDDDRSAAVQIGAFGSAGMQPYVIGETITTDEFQALRGEVVYRGVATGQYVNKGLDDIDGGLFVAEVEFVVDFGEGEPIEAADVNLGNMLGSISGFAQDGEAIGADWRIDLATWMDALTNLPVPVRLMSTPPHIPGGFAHGTFGKKIVGGRWAAEWFDGSRRDKMPGAIGGRFVVSDINSVSIVGAFAAVNQIRER